MSDREMEPRSILAREMAYGMYGWTDQEFCSDEDGAEFDRLDFLQLADIALRWTARHDAAIGERIAQAIEERAVQILAERPEIGHTSERIRQQRRADAYAAAASIARTTETVTYDGFGAPIVQEGL